MQHSHRASRSPPRPALPRLLPVSGAPPCRRAAHRGEQSPDVIAADVQAARRVGIEALDVLGPTIQFLTFPKEDDAPCVMRGVIPPGVVVALHSHGDPETYFIISGDVEALSHAEESFRWIRLGEGDVFHVPGGTKHAFRNQSRAPVVALVISTAKIGRFFAETGTPIPAGTQPSWPPSPQALHHFLEVADKYGYWNGTPEENAKIGLSLPPMPA